MCAYLCVSVRVSLLESFESEDSCWLHHLLLHVFLLSIGNGRKLTRRFRSSRPAKKCEQTRSRGSR